MDIRTIPCFFVEEKNQEALICFVSIFVCKNVFGSEGKCVENVETKSRTQESLFFLGLEVPGDFYSLGMLYEVAHLEMRMNGTWHDIPNTTHLREK